MAVLLSYVTMTLLANIPYLPPLIDKTFIAAPPPFFVMTFPSSKPLLPLVIEPVIRIPIPSDVILLAFIP